MKLLISSLLVVSVLTSCKTNKSVDKSPTENEKLAIQFFEYFNKHDWVKMAGMYADTADFKDPTFGKEIVKQTRQQTITKYAELNKIFPDLHDKVIQLYSSGENHIIVEFISSGTAPNGSKFQLPICTIFKIENGLITRDLTYFDNSGE